MIANCISHNSRTKTTQYIAAFHSIKKNYRIIFGSYYYSCKRQFSNDNIQYNQENKYINTENLIKVEESDILKPKCEININRILNFRLVCEENFNKRLSINNNSLRAQNLFTKSYHTNIFQNQLTCIKSRQNALIFYKLPKNKVLIFVKCYHDWKAPEFEYRKTVTANPKLSSRQNNSYKKLPTYLLYAAYGLGWAYGIKSHATHYVYYLAASAEVLALAKIEINLADIPEGRSMTFKWRGKPLFIRHRTPQQIEEAQNTDLSLLRDPEKDEDRCQKPEWLVVVGVCTHLGCVPVADVGDYPGGYYCPCHGSHFDVSGRARKGPAPTNLEVPEHRFDEDKLIVG